MKIVQILIILLLTSAITSAQNIEVKWGKETKSDKQLRIGGVLGSDPNGYLITKYNITGIFGKSKTWIARHNLDHEVEYTIEVPNEINKKDISREGMYKVKDKIFIFSSQNDKKADVNKLYLSVIDKTGNIGEEKLVDEISYKGKKDKGGFDIHHLPNSENFLITHNEGYSKKGNEEVNYKLYDYDFKLKWEKAIELPYKDKQFSIVGYQIDEAGNVYLYGNIPVSKDLNKKVIFAYYPATNKLEEVKVEFGKAFRISDLNFVYTKGELQFTGFYYDQKGGIQGVFITKINAKTLNTVVEKTIPFSKKDLLLFTTERAAKKGKGITANFDVRQILVKENGDFFIIGEAYQLVITTYRDPKTGATSTTYTYYYNDIMVVSLSKDAEINWVQKIPKKQISQNDGGYYSSYVFVNDENNLYMMFNDNPKNLSPKTKPEKRGTYFASTRNPKKLVVALSTVNQKTGEFSSEIFFKSKTDGKAVFVPKFNQKLNDNQTLIYAEKGKTNRFGVITVK